MKKSFVSLLVFALLFCLLSSCYKHDAYLDKTMYWENGAYCLELTSEGQASIYSISNNKYSPIHSGEYELTPYEEYDFGFIGVAPVIPHYFGTKNGLVQGGIFENGKSVVILVVATLENRGEIKLMRTSFVPK